MQKEISEEVCRQVWCLQSQRRGAAQRSAEAEATASATPTHHGDGSHVYSFGALANADSLKMVL